MAYTYCTRILQPLYPRVTSFCRNNDSIKKLFESLFYETQMQENLKKNKTLNISLELLYCLLISCFDTEYFVSTEGLFSWLNSAKYAKASYISVIASALCSGYFNFHSNMAKNVIKQLLKTLNFKLESKCFLYKISVSSVIKNVRTLLNDKILFFSLINLNIICQYIFLKDVSQ